MENAGNISITSPAVIVERSGMYQVNGVDRRMYLGYKKLSIPFRGCWVFSSQAWET